MSSINVNPTGGADNALPQPVQKVKRPIREVLNLPKDMNDAALKDFVITVFLQESVIDLFHDFVFAENGGVDVRPMFDEINRRIEELINSDYKYALKTMDKDIENAKQKLKLPSYVSKVEVYLAQVAIDMKSALSTIIGGSYRGDYKVPEAIESYTSFCEEMKEVVSTELRKRFSIGGIHKVPENVLEYYFDIKLQHAITQIHGHDPEFLKITTKTIL
ncbi:MAG: hypothetical protein HY094_02910 [Candidatus Melainabacteria bacterium]|nr:hypothetical protein [Candidatus Melainabacteria bacterium]